MTGRRKIVKFLSDDEIRSAVVEIARLAEDQRQHIALAGGAAMQLHGSDRLTKDVDFISESVIYGLEPTGRLSFGGIQAKTTTGVPIDLIVRDDEYARLYESALVFGSERVEGISMPVVSAEYMVAIKLAAARDKDQLDLRFLLTESEGLNYAKAREIVKQHLGEYAARELDRYRDEYLWLKEREDRVKPK